MKAEEKAPECVLDMHGLCAGPKVVRREGAPAWETPLMILKCGCTCHTRSPRSDR